MSLFKLHIAGLLDHSRDESTFIMHLEHWPKGPSLMCTILYHAIRRLRMQSPAPILYLQADNSSKENKNKFIFALLCLLIEFGWYQRIELHCMVVGHTHGPIDQVFSTMQSAIKCKTVASVPALAKMLPHFYHRHPPTPVLLDAVYDWKSYFLQTDTASEQPVMTKLFGHSRPQSFLFRKGNDGRARVFWRFSAADEAERKRRRHFAPECSARCTSCAVQASAG